MSVGSLIAAHGQTVRVVRPTVTQTTDGAMARAYAIVATLAGWIQPRASSDANYAGRDNLRNTVVAYFEGRQDIRTDDILLDESSAIYHVSGIHVPIERPDASPNCHTIVDATRVQGETVVLAP